MTYQTLIYSVEKDVVRITINRPAQLNAIDVLTAKELALAAKQCSVDPAVRGRLTHEVSFSTSILDDTSNFQRTSKKHRRR